MTADTKATFETLAGMLLALDPLTRLNVSESDGSVVEDDDEQTQEDKKD